jgi:thiol-disulfide isomerase/thioredoxin
MPLVSLKKIFKIGHNPTEKQVENYRSITNWIEEALDFRITIIAALVLVALTAGFWWRARTGRAKLVRSGELVDLGKLKATRSGKPVTSFGKKATLLQFSTEVCSICVQTAKYFRELESNNPDLSHIEVDLTDRMELAAHFNVMQTPTTLILDKAGRVQARIGGAPKLNVIKQELEKLEIK